MNKSEIWHQVGQELKLAKKMRPNWPVHIVAQASLINEDSGKLTRACLDLKYHAKTAEDKDSLNNNIRAEAIHVIATAIRFLENLK